MEKPVILSFSLQSLHVSYVEGLKAMGYDHRNHTLREVVFGNWVRESIIGLVERDHGRNSSTIDFWMRFGSYDTPNFTPEWEGSLLAEFRALLGVDLVYTLSQRRFDIEIMGAVLLVGVYQ